MGALLGPRRRHQTIGCSAPSRPPSYVASLTVARTTTPLSVAGLLPKLKNSSWCSSLAGREAPSGTPAAMAAAWLKCSRPSCGSGWFKKCAPKMSRITVVVACMCEPPTASCPLRKQARAACTPSTPRPCATCSARMPLLGSKISPELFTSTITSNCFFAPVSSIADSSEMVALQPGVSSISRLRHSAAAGIDSCTNAHALVKTSALCPGRVRFVNASVHLSMPTVLEMASICGTYVMKCSVAKCASRCASDSHSSTITKRVGESALLMNAYLMPPASLHVWCASTSAISSQRSCASSGTSLVTTTCTVCAGLASTTGARGGGTARGTPAALAVAARASRTASSALVVSSGWSDLRPSTK
mmetsp:Transcript_14071/g.32840  ORF Transcript_14071/g.32840 Transcript_14071/m.32840 type:complete len:360 (-) Transcript_14071:568-1647(-)